MILRFVRKLLGKFKFITIVTIARKTVVACGRSDTIDYTVRYIDNTLPNIDLEIQNAERLGYEITEECLTFDGDIFNRYYCRLDSFMVKLYSKKEYVTATKVQSHIQHLLCYGLLHKTHMLTLNQLYKEEIKC